MKPWIVRQGLCVALVVLAPAALAAERKGERPLCRDVETVDQAEPGRRQRREPQCERASEDQYTLPETQLRQLHDLEQQRQREVFRLYEPLPAPTGSGGWQ